MAFTEIDGASVEYHAAGAGPHLLLLHSLLAEMSVFDSVLPTLARNFRATCLNLPGSHPQEVALRKAALARFDAGCFSRACLALGALDSTPQLCAITNPGLILCGALDLTTPPALAKDLAQGIPGATYHEIADSGHCPMVEQPAALIACIEDFLLGAKNV